MQRSAGSAGTVTVQYQTTELTATADASTDRIQRTAHGLTNGTAIQFASSGTLPGGLTAATTYFVTNSTANNFQLLATIGGSVIDLTSAGTGTHWYALTGQALGGGDYTPTSGTLTFANGEIQKNFTLSIASDSLVEGNETLTMTLTGVIGGASLVADDFVAICRAAERV